MKRYLPIVILMALAVLLTSTGFQCGSAESTSAKLYMQQKQWGKAEESLLKELQKNPRSEESWFLLGEVRSELGNYSGMNDAFTKALEISDAHKNEIGRYRLATWAKMYNDGVTSYNKGRDSAAYYDKAMEEFRLAIAMEPDSASTYYVAALTSFAKRDYNEVVRLLETCLQKKSNDADAARFLGQMHYQIASDKLDAKDSVSARAEYLKAVDAFKIAYHAQPDSAENITNLIDAYDRTKQPDSALVLTRDAVRKDPGNKVFRFAYGVFLLKQEKYPESIEQFKKAVEIDPEYADAIYNCGVAYLNWGVALRDAARLAAEQNKKGKVKEDTTFMQKFREALPYLRKSVEIRSDDASLWQYLGKLYGQLNMLDDMRAAYAKYDQLTKGK